jgi:hypothetical protein
MLLSTLEFVIIMALAGLAGGALSGLKIAGKDLGKELAAMMGAFYGLTAVVPVAILMALYLLYSLSRG